MPSRWTFTIRPIAELLDEEMGNRDSVRGIWADPFCGRSRHAQLTNDLNPEHPATSHKDALAFLRELADESLDGVLFDPPYSPRQVSECYKNVGAETTMATTQMSFWSKCKDEIARIVRVGGKAICFGWNSMGVGKTRGFEMRRILLVPHGGARNDTIVTVEIKTTRYSIKTVHPSLYP